MNHPQEAARFLANAKRAKWHDEALWFVRSKRDMAAADIPEWEQLRQQASQIKAHTIANLKTYLQQFEQKATDLGAHVHWARDASEHNTIVQSILRDHGARRIVKSKSMLTEECQLNPHLENAGFEITDTDLGEWIVQLRNEPPSHIVLPAIHIKKEEVGELFHQKLGTRQGSADPDYLTESARNTLRKSFLQADAAITGVNFAIAETGGIVICTNEGNADMGTGLPGLHIACMGIEKIIPRAEDLALFLRLLARSGTGQPITAYTAHHHGPRPDGQLHIVLVDNGRTEILKQEAFRNSLHCIRCGACMNTCPVYRRSGGHSYGYTIPGPIGSILASARDPKAFYTLPYASSLCGSCTDICPVNIDLHHQLLAWRSEITRQKILPLPKRLAMAALSHLMRRPRLYRLFGAISRSIGRAIPRTLLYCRFNVWGRQRELPPLPKKSFRRMFQQEAARREEKQHEK
ncbi:MAG: lactate utilization protein B [Pirellulales bacterium]|nr:lactate utilization protein B [Pirellulales bacterium]